MKIYNILITTILLSSAAFSAAFDYGYLPNGYKYVIHQHNEYSYQHVWCTEHNGIEEHQNKDFTRVDCLTKTNAVEFDFAEKWAESIGQALHYQKMTGRRAKVVLILEKPEKQRVYHNRVKSLGEIHNFDVEFITPSILHLNPNGKCHNPDCKCNKHST